VSAAFVAELPSAPECALLPGTDALSPTADAFGQLGAEVLVRPSPWRLSGLEAELAAQWFVGWVGAACEQQPELVAEADAYARRRLAEATAGQLAVTVDHADLLILPRRADRGPG
jgi:hypothetical protein